MTKRIALLMAALMLLVSALVPVFAEGDAAATTGLIGYSDTLVEKVDLTNVADINTYDAANAAAAYKITDVAGFQKLVAIVNAETKGGEMLKGVTIYLANDIDISAIENQTPIGYMHGYYDKSGETAKSVTTASAKFSGTLDGQGYEIKGILIDQKIADDFQYVGFIGWASNATIKNIKLSGSVKQDLGTLREKVGADLAGCGAVVACSNNTTFYNVYSNITIPNANRQAGVFAGRGGGAYITNCSNVADIKGGDCAGFTGFRTPTTIVNCFNAGKIQAGKAAAFIARGSNNVKNPSTVENSVNVGEIVGTTGAALASVDTASAKVVISNCVNYGVLTGPEGKTGIGVVYNGEIEVVACEDKTGLAYIPTIVPTADYVGYSSARIEKVDTTNIPDIKNIDPEKGSEGILEAYKITDVAGFEHLSLLIDKYVSFTDVTIYLANDVDFSKVENFVPIGWASQMTTAVNATPNKAFNGTFDGLGNMVTGVKAAMTESHYKYAGGKPDTADTVNYGGLSFFGILNGATIKNFVVEGEFAYTADPNDHGCVAGIAFAAHNTTFDNCWTKVNGISVTRFTAGIVARAHGTTTITNCTNSGTLTGCQNVAGMVAYVAGPTTITNCRNIGDIVCMKKNGTAHDTKLVGSDHSAAGIAAWMRDTTTISGCINNGKITGVDNVAGIAGQIGNVDGSTFVGTFENNTNYGALAMDDPKDKNNNGTDNVPTIAAEGLWYAENNLASLTDTNNVDVRGTFDATLGMEAIVPDYTPEADPGLPPATQESTTEATTTAKVEDTKDPEDTEDKGGNDGTEGTEATEATVVTTTVTTTKAPDATKAPADDTPAKKGCGSTVFGGLAVIMLVSGAAVTLFKKKD